MPNSELKVTAFPTPCNHPLLHSAIEKLARDDQMLGSDRMMLRGLAEHGHLLFPGLLWFLISDEEGIAALAPLQAVTETDGRIRARALWSPTRFELLYADTLIRDGIAPARVGRALLKTPCFGAKRPDVIRVSSAPPGSCLHRILEDTATYGTVVRPGSSLLDCTRTSDDWRNSLSRNLRGQIRQSERRLRELGELKILEFNEGTAVSEAIERFVALEASGYKSGMSPLAEIPGDRSVLGGAVLAHATTGSAHLLELYVGSVLAASQLGIIRSGRLHLLKVAFNEAFENASPGTYLMAELIRRRMIDRKIDMIDCCVRQPWHDRWHPTTEDRVSGGLPNKDTAVGLGIHLLRRTRQVAGRVSGVVSSAQR